MKKAFTLAEIMIALVIIGVLTAILLPAARNIMPNENVVKFKKAHNILHSAIMELTTSDKYYYDGDLGIKPDGTLITSGNPANSKYFCETLADVLNVKEVNCSESTAQAAVINLICNLASDGDAGCFALNGKVVTDSILEQRKKDLDSGCKKASAITSYSKQITTNDGMVIFDGSPNATFGHLAVNIGNRRAYGSKNTPTFYDSNGFNAQYKPVCIDIDGIHPNATQDDCVNECPFGYGIRVDGKILNGARAEEWIKKSIQEKE